MSAAAVGEVRYSSPLASPGHVQIGIMQDPSREAWKSREDSFVNDAIKTNKHHYPRKIPIIPKYDPLYDAECAKYFTSPMVQEIIGITLFGKNKKQKDPRKNINKLSVRRRCPPSPSPELVSDLQDDYVNDAIITEKNRTKYNDTLLPKYEPIADRHCRDYFDRSDIRKLLARTMATPRDKPLNMHELKRWGPRNWDEEWYPLTVMQESRGQLPPYDKGRNGSQSPRKTGSNAKSSESRVSTDRSTRSSFPEQPLAETPRISATNKLSYRRWCIPTPGPEKIRERERMYVNDAVPTEKRRTKYTDIIPKYDASADPHSRAYFTRPDIKKLVKKTCGSKPVGAGE